jgi:archaellum component FlaC
MRKCFVYSAIMESMREAWTDERLDDLTNRMERDFKWVDARFDKVDARFDKVDARFERVDERFDKIDARLERFEERITSRFERLWQLMLAGYVAVVLGILVS